MHLDDIQTLRAAVAHLTQAQKRVRNAMDVAEKAYLRQFGAALLAAREQAGLNQHELADLAGLVRTSITNMEAGKQDTTVGSLLRLAVALNVQPASLLPQV